jgi:flagellar M-ring protein FliF
MPVQGRIIDRVGQTRVFAVTATVNAIALIVLVVLALLFLAFRSSKKRADTVFPAADRQELDEARRALAVLQQPREIEPRGEARELAPGPTINPNVNEAKRALVRDEIGDLVERQPEEVAQLLRGWLADRRS